MSWTASPSDATPAPDLADLLEVLGSVFDVSGNPKTPVANETERVIITPHWGGSTIRLRLSNRFGADPVTFNRVTLAKHQSGASVVPGSSVAVTFGGNTAITASAGEDVVSDPVAFSFDAFDHLAVSIHLAGSEGMPTEHFTGRQTSFRTLPGAGDHTADTGDEAFLRQTTSRYYVTELDVRARASVGAVVAFGDSITDGYQGQLLLVPETAEGLDADGRWPDILARRLHAANRPLSVANAGITGNRVWLDGAVGSGVPQYGPSGLSRLRTDAIDLPGVTTAIILQGINDLGQTPSASADEVIGGLRQIVRRLRRAGLRVLLGTLTPAAGTVVDHYGTAATNAKREQINAWIRSSRLPDAIVDFDAAVRDPEDPSRIDPRYDGSDHLHFNLAGYRALANAVPLRKLRDRPCR